LQVYENIASHFSHTRHKPWPNVLSFVQSLPIGSLLVDVGCGNGKYFDSKTGIFEVSSQNKGEYYKLRNHPFEQEINIYTYS
jgi:alkylated DNA repair protein alkB family protein 8